MVPALRSLAPQARMSKVGSAHAVAKLTFSMANVSIAVIKIA
jgi:hypothetical protein